MKAYEYLADAMAEGTTEAAMAKIQMQLRAQCKNEQAFDSAYKNILRKALALSEQRRSVSVEPRFKPVEVTTTQEKVITTQEKVQNVTEKIENGMNAVEGLIKGVLYLVAAGVLMTVLAAIKGQ